MKQQPRRILTPYQLHTGKLEKPLRFLVISDLHSEGFDDLLPLMAQADAVLVPGDVSNRYRQIYDEGLRFLRESARRLPTFFSPGNHEIRQEKYAEAMEYFKMAKDRDNYGRAFRFYRKDWVEENIGWVVALLAAVLIIPVVRSSIKKMRMEVAVHERNQVQK